MDDLFSEVLRFAEVARRLGSCELGSQENFTLGDLGFVLFVDLGELFFLRIGDCFLVPVLFGETFHSEFVGRFHGAEDLGFASEVNVLGAQDWDDWAGDCGFS